MKLQRLLPMLLLLGMSGFARGEIVADLYEANAPVAGQGKQAREAAIREALAKVLVKVSGDRSLPGRQALAAELDKANGYVQQYRYRALDERLDAASETVSPDRLLWVKFDAQAVDRLLRDKGAAVWGSARPATLVWLGLEQQGRRHLFQPESETSLRGALQEVAGARGLPILFPLMDLEDRANLQVSDIWGSFEESIRRASDRYLPDVILVGRLRKRGGGDWIADWTLYQPDTVTSWQGRDHSRRAAATAGLDQAVDRLAARFAPRVAALGGSLLRVRVSGLDHLADYVLVKDYLDSLGLIEQLDLLAVDPYEVSFLARVQGARESLERSIMLGRVLEPVDAHDRPMGAAAVSPETFDAESLSYRLRR